MCIRERANRGQKKMRYSSALLRKLDRNNIMRNSKVKFEFCTGQLWSKEIGVKANSYGVILSR
jgi:hypothetical protein